MPANPQTEGSASTLGSVEIRNYADQTHTLDVLIERNGTIVYWTTVPVAAKQDDTLGGAVIVPGEFVDKPGEYEIKTRLENHSTGKQIHLTSDADDTCYVVQIRIGTDATLDFATMTGAYECNTE